MIRSGDPARHDPPLAETPRTRAWRPGSRRSGHEAPEPGHHSADLIDSPGLQHRSAGHPVPAAATRHTLPFIEVLRILLCFVFPFHPAAVRALTP